MRYLFALVLGSVGVMAQNEAEADCALRSGSQVMPLVELYTSEGCSSCPPADRWLSKRFNDDDVNFLAFHVDYWDDIGWPDRFGSPLFAQRQRARVAASGGSTVYTPQVMVGELVRADWNGARTWQQTLREARQPARVSLALRLDNDGRTDGSGWRATVGAVSIGPVNASEGAQLWLARYVDGQTTVVRAGENQGATLRHDRVVLELSGPWQLGSEAMSQGVALAAAAHESRNWGVTAFVQDARGQTLQSLDLPAAACSRSL